jgi:hypothetical protein
VPHHPLEELVFSSLVGAKLVIAAVAGSLSIGGVAAAAVTGVLPGPFAHGTSVSASESASGDPSDSSDPSESPDPSEPDSPTPSTSPAQTGTPTPSDRPTTSASGRPVGPDATGPAAFGLCHAFGGSKAISKANNPSIAYRNLLAAATAAGQTVQTYCATILGSPLPTSDPSGTPTPTTVLRHHGNSHGHGHGRPGSHG